MEIALRTHAVAARVNELPVIRCRCNRIEVQRPALANLDGGAIPRPTPARWTTAFGANMRLRFLAADLGYSRRSV